GAERQEAEIAGEGQHRPFPPPFGLRSKRHFLEAETEFERPRGPRRAEPEGGAEAVDVDGRREPPKRGDDAFRRCAGGSREGGSSGHPGHSAASSLRSGLPQPFCTCHGDGTPRLPPRWCSTG